MNQPVDEIEGVIRGLTQTSPSEQRTYIDTYFTPDAAFTHPFCRTGSFGNSRFLIRAIYRWYKIMSPRIDLKVHSIAYDERNLRMYVNISQVFRIWVIPFYAAHVSLVSVLQLRTHHLPVLPTSEAAKPDASPTKYYIESQEDLYQVNQFLRFVWPFPTSFVWTWQVIATAFCLLGAIALYPITFIEEMRATQSGPPARRTIGAPRNGIVNGTSEKAEQESRVWLEAPKSGGNLVTTPAVHQA